MKPGEKLIGKIDLFNVVIIFVVIFFFFTMTRMSPPPTAILLSLKLDGKDGSLGKNC